jgi:hypothetical protein
VLPLLAPIAAPQSDHENLDHYFRTSLITVAFEVYSDAALTSAEISQSAALDTVTKTISALKRE